MTSRRDIAVSTLPFQKFGYERYAHGTPDIRAPLHAVAACTPDVPCPSGSELAGTK